MPNANPDYCDVLVIGGGIVGLCSALAICARGLSTMVVAPALIERTASWGNAGHIAIEQTAPIASIATLRSLPRRLFARGGPVSLPPRQIGAWLPFALRLIAAARPSSFARGSAALGGALEQALPAWRRLVAAIGAEDLLREDGHVVVWEHAAAAAQGIAAWQAAPIGGARLHAMTETELAVLRGLVRAPLAAGLRFEDTAQIADPTALAQALAKALHGAGVAHHAGSVRAIEAQGRGGCMVTLGDGDVIAARRVVVAAGAASAGLLRPLGHRVPLIAERGYHLQAAAPEWPEDLPPVVFEGRGMIVTRFRSGLRAASFTEFAALDAPPDPRKWARLRRHASELGLPIGADATPWMGARPTLPDYLPAIGRSRRLPDLFYAFGHQHLGLTLGPRTGEWVGALVAGEAADPELAAFDLDRFAAGVRGGR